MKINTGKCKNCPTKNYTEIFSKVPSETDTRFIYYLTFCKILCTNFPNPIRFPEVTFSKPNSNIQLRN